MISREEMDLFTFIDSPREAYDYLKDFLTTTYLRKGGNGQTTSG